MDVMESLEILWELNTPQMSDTFHCVYVDVMNERAGK